jgi:hypothetical protein
MNELNFMHENISGIFNYCDRWCEKCTYTNRCLLFKQEAEREIKHILRDENKNDPDVLAKDLADDFKEAFDHINKFMDDDEESEAFDFDEDNEVDDAFEKELFDDESDDDERPSKFLRNANNPLIVLSEKLFNDFYDYYDRLKLHNELDEKNPQNVLQQNLDTLGWYTPQISVKIRMSFWNKHKLSKSKDPEFAEIDEEMLNVSSRIAFIGIENCISALNNLLQQKPGLESEILGLLSTTKHIKQLFVEEFPAALTYKRPYFD